MTYLILFYSFFKIGLFSIGGGYAALPLISEEIITNKGWISPAEFADLLTISTMTPGPIAINASTFIGTKVGGYLGSIIATLGCITPSFIIVITLAYFYYKYHNLTIIKKILTILRPVVVGLIGTAGVAILVTAFWRDNVISFSSLDKKSVLIFFLSLIGLIKFKLDSVLMIIISGIAGIFLYGNII